MDTAHSTTIGLVIPVLNAERYLDALLPALQQQSLQPDRFLVMDSQSDDASVERFQAAGAEVVTVERSEFDHGGTRQRAAEILSDCDILIYLTQDAIPASSESFAILVAAFDDPKVGVAYGRQLPHKDATPISAHARLFNYPPESHSVSFAQRQSLGIRVFFASNSFAAYRHSALTSIGGFPRGALFGEDALATAKLLKSGWCKCYVADAKVFHSHNYSISSEFRRAFDIGVFHSSEPWLIETFGGAGGEGHRFLASEIRYLADHAPALIILALIRTASKVVGYSLGRRNRMLPSSWNRFFSLNRHYWSRSVLASEQNQNSG
jgi:rhamnosyltransferase